MSLLNICSTFPEPGRRFGLRSGLAISAFIICCACFGVPTEAQQSVISPYDIRVLHQPGLIFLQLTTNEGKINVYFPEGMMEGEPFSGTMESLGTISSSATFEYTMSFAGQIAKVRDGPFHWKVPQETDGYLHLRFADLFGHELAVAEIPVLRARDSREPALPGAEQLHFPAMIQSGLPSPMFGPFDGDSSTTLVQLSATPLRVLAELFGKAIVEGPRVTAGVTPYIIRKGPLEGRGETRVLNIEQRLPPIPQKNGKSGKWRLRITGLDGLHENVPLKFEIGMPHNGIFGPTPPYSYFPSWVQYRVVLPSEIRSDGSFHAEQVIERIVPGPLDATAELIVPQDLHDLVQIVLRSPRQNYSRAPAQEHAEALKPYGDAVLPVLAEFLVSDLANDAYNIFFLGKDHGARWVIPYLPKMDGQPLGMALDAFVEMAQKEPEFPYRKELHASALGLVERKQSVAAISALGRLGDADDVPVLQRICANAPNPFYQPFMQACEAALARFGVKEYIDRLARRIKTPDAFWSQAVQGAVYAGRPELIPALCVHIDDPSHWYGDYGSYPGTEAQSAIVAIEHKPLTTDQIAALCKSVAESSAQ